MAGNDPTPRTRTRPVPQMGMVAPPTGDQVAELEDLGVASLWVGGHVASPNPAPEALAWLARLVEQAKTVPVGTAILLLPLYPPALVAKQLADIDRASQGRLVVGIGVGGEHRSDFDAVEVPIGERGSRTNEAMALLRRFWTAEPVTHVGRHHRFTDVRIHPAPWQAGGPPLVVSGRQPVAMRRAATLGDGWMPYLYSPERYARSREVIEHEAANAGRSLADFGWYAYVFVSVDDDEDVAKQVAVASLGGTYNDDFRSKIDRIACFGTVPQVAARLGRFVEAGADHLVVVPMGPDRRHAARRLLSEVLPIVQERYGAD